MKRLLATFAALATASTLVACGAGDSEDNAAPSAPVSTDYFGYQAASRLVTTNAASAFGTATNAQVLSSRLYPAAFVPGPEGQIIPNTDLVKTEELPERADGLRQIRYTISEKATYSDDIPVSCEDFLLAYTAGSMPGTFGSDLPVMASDVEDLQCAAGAKDFTLVLKKDKGGRWRHLFGPGTVLPSHVIAKQVGMSQEELVTALQSWDPATVEPIADVWRFGFMLTKFDPATQVSYGPFVIDKVGSEGEVVLKRNENYYGDPAALDTLVIWPANADSRTLKDTGALRIADSPSAKPEWLDVSMDDNPYEVESHVGALTDTLTLSEEGLFADKSMRQAFAKCVDAAAMAKASSRVSGVDVPPVYLHTLSAGDPIAAQLKSIGDAHAAVDVQGASAASGTTVRVGYQGPDERLAAMVAALKDACAPAGITIEDSSSDFMSKAYLELDPDTGAPTIDAFLGAVDPLSQYSSVDARIGEVEALKKDELALWDSVPAIPVAAQPRTFVVDQSVEGVLPNTGASGIGWNMDRWREGNAPAAASTTR